jgi:hypothetical protein
MIKLLDTDANGWSRVSDSRPWRGKQALSEQGAWSLGSRNKTDETELGQGVSITITIDIGRPRAVGETKKDRGRFQTPGQKPRNLV